MATPDLSATLGWRLSNHAKLAAAQRDFDLCQLLLAAAEPEVTYTCHNYGAGREARIRGELCVIAHAPTTTVITAMLHGQEYTDDAEVRARRRPPSMLRLASTTNA